MSGRLHWQKRLCSASTTSSSKQNGEGGCQASPAVGFSRKVSEKLTVDSAGALRPRVYRDPGAFSLYTPAPRPSGPLPAMLRHRGCVSSCRCAHGCAVLCVHGRGHRGCQMLQRLCDACEAVTQCITRSLLQPAARSVNVLASLLCAVLVFRPVPERASAKHLKSVLCRPGVYIL